MPRGMAAGWLLAMVCCAALCAQSIEVRVDLPAQGHVWAVGPLPADTPPILAGPSGIRAYRLQDLGEQAAIYGMETFAELAPQDGRIPLWPATDAEGASLWWGHPHVMDNPAAVAGQVTVDGRAAPGPQWSLVTDGEARKRFRSVHDTGEHWVSLWCDTFARSPVVHVVGFVARKDRRAQLAVPIDIRFEEQLAFPLERLHGGRLRVDGGAIVGDIDLERGGIYPLRFSLLCRRGPVHGPGPTGDLAALDDLDEQALAAGADGPRWFLPTRWRGSWLGVDGELRTPAGEGLARRGWESWGAAHRMTDLRPWASMPAASQGGSQPSLAMTWWAPLWAPLELRPVDVHLWSADDWALRPMHLLDPGAPDPLTGLRQLGVTVASRQVFGLDELAGQTVPRFQTRGELLVHLPNGNVDRRTPPDELHTADLPLVATYAATGDPLCKWLLDSVRELDEGSRQVSSGWRSNGRGEGRTGVSMLLAARTMRGDVQARVVEHNLLRLVNAVEDADTAHLPETATVRPIELYQDARLHCDAPAWIPYEEAQAAWWCWLLWEDSGDKRALEAAYRWGLTVASTLHQVGGAWRVPYACTLLADGRALSAEQLTDARYVHPSTWTIHWSGCGLRALVNAAAVIDSTAEHADIVERARVAIEWIDAQPITAVEQIHQGLQGAAVAPRPVR